jgi:2'-hydroxyisoflavone reductase
VPPNTSTKVPSSSAAYRRQSPLSGAWHLPAARHGAIFGLPRTGVKRLTIWYAGDVRLLVLGGTRFLGRAAVEVALARGHELTLFNRGETNPALFPKAEKLHGDRMGDLAALRGREWDAVLDPSGYLPAVVRASAELLAGAAGHYLFVSSVSAYASQATANDEDSPLAELGDAPDDRMLDDYSNYGSLKVLCEAAVAEAFGAPHAIVRPGLIVGAHDPTGRFTYWPHRIAHGGEVLAPAPPERKVQFVDVRDLGGWLVDLAERHATGAYNATHPGRTWNEVLETCREVAGSDATFTWVSDSFLVEHEVGEWMELPLWIQSSDEAGIHEADVSRAVAAGLEFRPLEETVRDTLELALPTDEAGLTPEREAELLGAAHS